MENEMFISALERAKKHPVTSIIVVSEPSSDIKLIPSRIQEDAPRVPLMIVVGPFSRTIDATRYLDEYAQLTGARHVTMLREPVLFWGLPLAADASKEAMSTLDMLNKLAAQSSKLQAIIDARVEMHFSDKEDSIYDFLTDESGEPHDIQMQSKAVIQAYRTVVETRNARPRLDHERAELMSACEKLVRAARGASAEVSRLFLTVVNECLFTA